MSFQVLLKAAMLRHVWAISQKVDTHVEMGTYIYDKKPNIWFMHTPANTSWIIKNMQAKSSYSTLA